MYRIEHSKVTATPFRTLDEAQTAHLELVERADAIEGGWREVEAEGGLKALRAETVRLRLAIRAFEWRLAATGARQEGTGQRLLAQSLLDFWALRQTELRNRALEYAHALERRRRASPRGPAPKTLLAFDPSTATQLADAAETAFANLPDDAARAIARAIFMDLIETVEGSPTCRPLAPDALAALGPPEQVEAVVAAFESAGVLIRVGPGTRGGARLLPAHDTLHLHWPRWRDWAVERVRDEPVVVLTRSSAEVWRENNSDDDLPQGEALERAAAYADRDPLIAAYVAAGRELAIRNRRTARRVRGVFVLAVVAVVAALTLGVFDVSDFRNEPEPSATAGVALAENASEREAAVTEDIVVAERKAPATIDAAASNVPQAPTLAPGFAAWVWIGSTSQPQLADLNGAPVDPGKPGSIERGGRYQLRFDMNLREAPPKVAGNVGAAVTGTGYAGFTVVALGEPQSHDVRATRQYWLNVKLVPRVYVQVPRGAPEVLADLQSTLREAGYDVPLIEVRPDSARINQVRYYFPAQDKEPAERLAADVNRLLRIDPGSPSAIVARAMPNPRLKAVMREGVLELWLSEAAMRAHNFEVRH